MRPPFFAFYQKEALAKVAGASIGCGTARISVEMLERSQNGNAENKILLITAVLPGKYDGSISHRDLQAQLWYPVRPRISARRSECENQF